MPEIAGLQFNEAECHAPEVVELLNNKDVLGAAFKLLDIVEDDTELRQHVWRSLQIKQKEGITHEWVMAEMQGICDAKKRSNFADDLLHYTHSSFDWN